MGCAHRFRGLAELESGREIDVHGGGSLHGIGISVEGRSRENYVDDPAPGTPELIAWTGATFGIKAKHVYRLEPRNGVTLVHTEESYEGGVTRLLRGSLQKTLDKALSDGLRYLKAETERRRSPA